MSTVEQRLSELGIVLPEASNPAASYTNFVIFVNAEPDYEAHNQLLNGCSDLMVEVFGSKGVHARSVFGAASVRDNLPVIIDSIFEVEE